MATSVKTLGSGCSYIVLLSIFFLLSLPIIILFAVILSLASGLGTVTTLSCKRIEPTEINCRSSKSVFFGLIQQKPTSLLRVTAAKSNSKIIKGNKIKIKDNYVTLFTQQGKITVFNNTINVESDGREMEALTGQINAFINSSEPSLIIKQDLRLDWERNIGGFIGLFLFSLILCCLGFMWLLLLVTLVYNLFRAIYGLLIS
jgi:hypothetical protein